MIFTTPEKTDLEQGKTQLKLTPSPGKKKGCCLLALITRSQEILKS